MRTNVLTRSWVFKIVSLPVVVIGKLFSEMNNVSARNHQWKLGYDAGTNDAKRDVCQRVQQQSCTVIQAQLNKQQPANNNTEINPLINLTNCTSLPVNELNSNLINFYNAACPTNPLLFQPNKQLICDAAVSKGSSILPEASTLLLAGTVAVYAMNKMR